MLRYRGLALCVVSLVAGGTVIAQVNKPANPNPVEAKPATKPAKKPATKPAEDKPDEWLAPMDYGPFLMTSVARNGKPYKSEPFQAPNGPKFPIDIIPDMVATKGIVIPLGPKDANGKPAATVVFDTERLAMAAGWTGGWLDLKGSMLTNHKGTSLVTLEGQEIFRLAIGNAGGRTPPNTATPARAAKFGGVKVSHGRVTLCYGRDGATIEEMPGYADGLITRTFSIKGRSSDLKIPVADIAAGNLAISEDGRSATLQTDGLGVVWAVSGDAAATLRREQDGLSLLFTSAPKGSVVLAITRSAASEASANQAKAQAVLPDSAAADPHAAPDPRWKPVTTAGKLGDASGTPPRKGADPAFVSDDLTVPFKNDYNSWFRLGGLDFFSDGRAAVCTINGDVWIVSGIDAKLEKLTWTRFATGLYMPLGLCIVKDEVYVRGRDQITRLHDLNADGEADFYENFSPEGETHPSYHGLVFDLQTDADGNFYYARGGIGMRPELEGHGQMIQLSPDGKTAKAIASGLRAPNGLGVVRGKWITVGDNQGNWIPTSRVSLVDPNGPNPFLGFLPHHHQESMPTEPVPPLVWIPHALDNSSGGQCEIPAGIWGDFGGQWIHSSFGAASVMLLLPDAAAPDGQMPKQAAVARIPLDFATGVMRPRFNPKDGQLYIVGVGGGWQTKGTADAGFYRIRHTGKPSHLPTKFAVVPGGVQLSFAVALDKEDASDPDNYAVEQWNYKWTEKYGSPDFSAVNPDKAGHDEVEVKSVKVSDDGKTVMLKFDKLMPVNQMLIECRLITADDKDLDVKVYATINAVPAP